MATSPASGIPADELRGFERVGDAAHLRIVPIVGGAPPEKAAFALALLDALLAEWSVEGKIRSGAAGLLAEGHFLAVAYEPAGGDLSGCTKDSLTRTIQAIEEQFGRVMLAAPRMALVRGDGGAEFVNQREFRERRAAGAIDESTPVFDHLLATLGDLRAGKLRTTVGASWYAPVGA